MFCPNCGKSDQIEDTYCRGCGEYLSDLNKNALMRFGGITPRENAKVISFMSFFAAIISLLGGLWMYFTDFSVPIILYLGAALLICNAVWHISNFYAISKLSKRINPVEKESSEQLKNKTDSSNQLPEADFSNNIPVSVTEHTTKNLKENAKRLS